MSSDSKKRSLDFELNLVPFIDLLSVCICFLLMTAVWLQVGSFEVKQAVGGQAATEKEKKATLWIQLAADGSAQLEAKDSRVPAKIAKGRIAGVNGRPNFEEVKKLVQEMRNGDPTLATALIHPTAGSIYEDLIDLMDQIKRTGIVSLGVSPL